jgi:HK97 family phage portal protein
MNIQSSSSRFFPNGPQPGGLLMSEHPVPQDMATRLKETWETNFSGDNAGKIAMLGGGLKYQPLEQHSATDTQLSEQINWIDEKICSCFGMPPHKVGVGDQPNYNNIEALNQQYWSECLQDKAEAMQTLLVEGLGAHPYVIKLDTADLLKMDTATMVKAASEGIRAGFLAPNEARRIFFNLPPVEGGETPYMQHQDYSLGALARRDATAPAPESAGAAPDSGGVEQQAAARIEYQKCLELTT